MKKITDEDLRLINDMRQKVSLSVSEAGQIALQVGLLEQDRSEIDIKINELLGKRDMNLASFKVLLTQEEALIQRLLTQYGAGSIDFDTGEFTSE